MKHLSSHPLRLFAIATLLPAVLLLVGALFGGPAVWLGLLCMTGLVAGLDHLIARVSATAPEGGTGEFPNGDPLSIILAAAHVILLFTAVFALGRGSALSAAQHLGLFAGVGLWLGQVSNSNAHELIHRTDKRLFRLGKWLYISLLFGHHTSAHRKVHHRFVGSLDDPNTAQLGESYYAFFTRAWADSFSAGWEMEKSVLMRHGGTMAMRRHPYIVYGIGAVGFLGLAAFVGGFFGLMWFVGLAGFAQAQLILSDYVQHYGLQRRKIDPIRLEPVGPQHCWNAPHWYSSAMMLHAPRHSDHHANPSKPYTALTLDKYVPMLPRSLPVMAVIALYPPAWRRIMDNRARQWKTAAQKAAA